MWNPTVRLAAACALVASCSPVRELPGPAPVSPQTLASEALLLVQPPKGPHRVLQGSVRLDARYAVAQAGARLIGDATGSYVQVGGSVVSNGSGNLIANHGAGIISDAGQRYRLTAQVAGADVLPLPGELLPGAGVTVSVRSLLTGAPMALGSTPDDLPVKALWTDPKGQFTLYLPPHEGGIVVEARVQEASGKRSTDPGLTYDLCPPHGASSVAVDEDSAAVCRLLWLSLYHVLRDALSDAPDGLHRRGVLKGAPAFERLAMTARGAGLVSAREDERDAVAARCAEALVGGTDPWRVPVTEAGGTPAMEALLGLIRDTREAATERWRRDPAVFSTWPTLASANAAREKGTPNWEMLKPADLNRFLTDTYLARQLPRPDLAPLLGRETGADATWRQALDALLRSYARDIEADHHQQGSRLRQLIESWRAWEKTAP
ncbi:MAG: hypothetical protein VKP62_11030 [Candidatus Sericytochromatia bacterium]|nr:hypothetical protein [Candidatus Sericytochromatia bacterium]